MENRLIKILAIDDNQDNLISLKALIKEAFPSALILMTTSGQNGLELAANEDPDVILLDIIMPVMDGFEVCKKLKSDQKMCNIPVVFITAVKGNRDSRIRALEVGAEAFLAKPIDRTELTAQIRAMVKIKMANIENRNEKDRLAILVEEQTHRLKETHLATLTLLEDLQVENDARKKSEEALRQSEVRFRQLVESSPDAIFVHINNRFVFLNKAAISIFGIDAPENLIGKSVIDRFHRTAPEIVQGHIQILNSEIAHVQRIEEICLKMDGTEFPVELSTVPINYEGNNGTLVFVRDITERKSAELKLRESEERLNMIVGTTNAVLYRLKYDDMKYEYINPAIQRLTGYEAKEINEIKFGSIVEKIENASGIEIDSEKMKYNREKLHYEFRADYLIRKKDGGYCWLSDHSYPWFDDSKELIGSIGILTDITKRKEAEKEIIAQRNKFEQLFDNSPVAIALLNNEDEIQLINNSFALLFGYTYEESIGKSINQLVVPPDLIEEGNYMSDSTRTGKTITKYSMRKKSDGTLVFVQIVGIPVIVEGKTIAIYAMYVDLTERKKAEEETQRAKEKAEEMNRVKSYFFSNMSHELRTPLIGILGFSDLMQDYIQDNKELSKMAKTINSSGLRLLDTLNKILQLSKIESEKVDYNPTNTDIIPIIKNTFRLFTLDAKSSDIELVADFEETEIICCIDSNLFRDSLNNLINNAIKFSKQGTVIIRVRKNIEKVFIEIIDTGIGIPDNKKDQIWEAFRQASEGLNRSYEGTGLGLSITKKYTELMGGKISFHSIVKVGTTFLLEFPLSSTLIKNVKEIKHPDLNQRLKPKTKQRILYVEDDEIAVYLIRRIVKDDYFLDSAINSDFAIQKLNEFRYDGILMDINLKTGRNGVELTKIIRNISGYETIPIIAITAFVTEKEKDLILTSGVTEYISKPFNKDDLRNLIKKVFGD